MGVKKPNKHKTCLFIGLLEKLYGIFYYERPDSYVGSNLGNKRTDDEKQDERIIAP